MRRTQIYMLFALMTAGNLLSIEAQDIKVISKDTLSSKFTIVIGDHTQKRGKPVTVIVCSQFGANARQATILLSEDAARYVVGKDTTVLMLNSLPNTCRSTTWTLVRNTSLRLYREGVLLGTVKEETLKENIEYGCRIIGPKELLTPFDGNVVSKDEAITPKEEQPGEDKGTALTNYSDKLKNLAPDPCCNFGIKNGAPGVYTTSNAAFNADATVTCTTDAYSGSAAILCEDGAENGQTVLTQQLSFASGNPYLIRFMARSDGYRARLFIEGENNWIDIPDTDNEWKRIECVFTPSSARTALSILHLESKPGASLTLDDWEIYAALSATSKVGANEYIAGVQLSSGQNWQPAHAVESHWVGFRNSNTQSSTVDTDLVKVSGLTSLTMPVEGSKLYALSFPGALNGMHVTGNYDMASHTNEQLINGIDYVLQRYDSPRFEFMPSTDENGNELPTPAGCYIVQFVDNLDGTNVTLNFAQIDKEAYTSMDAHSEYSFVGNPTFNKYTPEGKFLRFDSMRRMFVLTRDEELNPFEAYIATTASAPVATISTGYDTRLKRMLTPEGGRLGISAKQGCVTLRADISTEVSISSLTGQQVGSYVLQAGIPVSVALPAGFYIIGNEKIFIR